MKEKMQTDALQGTQVKGMDEQQREIKIER